MSNKKFFGKIVTKVAASVVLVAGFVLATSCDNGWRYYNTVEVGDIILKNGIVWKPADYVEGSNTAAAVIVRAASSGKPAHGVGIRHNRSGLAWCLSSADGYNKNITTLPGDIDSGFMDVSTGLEKLKAAVNDASNNLDNYPAWKFCAEYGTSNNLTGDLATGWYLPTMAELNTIYQNKETVEASLIKVGGDIFDNSWYWSSCQSSSGSTNASVLSFCSGRICAFQF